MIDVARAFRVTEEGQEIRREGPRRGGIGAIDVIPPPLRRGQSSSSAAQLERDDQLEVISSPTTSGATSGVPQARPRAFAVRA